MFHYNKNVGVPWNAHNNKNIAPLVGAAMISGASSLLGGGLSAIFGSSQASKSLQAQREANATNLQIARETNEANANLWREQSEYNTPVNQMARFRAAGINPYMAMSQISSGNAETAPQMQGSSIAPEYSSQTAAIAQQGLTGLADSISSLGSLYDQYLQRQNMQAQNRIVEANAKYSEQMAFQRLMETMQRNNLLSKENQHKLMENYYLPKLNDMTLQQGEQAITESRQRVALMQFQKGLISSQTSLNKVMQSYHVKLKELTVKQINSYDARFRAELKEIFSRIGVNKASIKTLKEQADVYHQTAAKILKETQGMNPRAAWKAAYWMSQKAMWEAISSEDTSFLNSWNAHSAWSRDSDGSSDTSLRDWMPFIGSAAGAVVGSSGGPAGMSAGAATGAALGELGYTSVQDYLDNVYK